jgi:hypothetical protein
MKSRSLNLLSVISLVVVLLAACNQGTPAPAELEPQVTKTYQPDSSNFANPERGFFYQRIAWDSQNLVSWGSPPTAEVMRQARQNGYTVLRVYYLIPEFRFSDLSRAFLDSFAADLQRARAEGVKLIPLFSYNFPGHGDDYLDTAKNPDAPLNMVLWHLEQLKPIIQENSDVIAMWDAGFLGSWGEWHHSHYGHFSGIDDINDSSKQVLFKLLETVPSNRAVTIRYVRQKFAVFGTTPIATDKAFTTDWQARVGHKNDCYLTSADDWTGYAPDVNGQKNFLNQDNLFVPQMGETCSDDAQAQPYIQCDNALKDMARLRFSTLNTDFNQGVISLWRTQGCLEDIQKRLGYRFELVSSSVPSSVSKTGNLRMSFQVRNVGFASPYNGRGLAVVLRDKTTKQTYPVYLTNGKSVPSNRTLDPRFWQPGTTTTVTINQPVPSWVPTGNYDVLLHLYDPAPGLEYRSEYAIRFANQNLWEDTTGYNALQQSLSVVASQNGLRGGYYNSNNFTGTPVTRIDSTINFNWGTGSPVAGLRADNFTARWSGVIVPRYSETYTFSVPADDGVRLGVNGQQIINRFEYGPAETSGSIRLSANKRYALRLEYLEGSQSARVSLQWQSPSQAKEVVPSSQLFTQ